MCGPGAVNTQHQNTIATSLPPGVHEANAVQTPGNDMAQNIRSPQANPTSGSPPDVQTSQNAADIATAQLFAKLPAPVRAHADRLQGGGLASGEVRDELDALYVDGTNADAHLAADTVAPKAISGAIARDDTLKDKLKAQVAHLVAATTTEDITQAMAELRDTATVLKESGQLGEPAQKLFDDMLAAGEAKIAAARALASQTHIPASTATTLIGRNLGMSALRAEDLKLTDKETKQAQDLAQTQKRLNRVTSSKASRTTLETTLAKAKNEVSQDLCRTTSAQHRQALLQQLDTLRAETQTPADFARATSDMTAKVARLLLPEDRATVLERFGAVREEKLQRFETEFLARNTPADEGARRTVATLLRATGFDAQVEAALVARLGSGNGDDLSSIAKGLEPTASAAERAEARAAIDKLLADDLTLLPDALAIKSALFGNKDGELVTLEHARTVAFAEVATALKGVEGITSFSDMSNAKLDALLAGVAKNKQGLAELDLLLISARFKDFALTHTDAAHRNPADVPEFLALLPEQYRTAPENLRTFLDKGIVGTLQAEGVKNTLTHAADSGQVRDVLRESDPAAEHKRAVKSAQATAARLLNLNSVTSLEAQSVDQQIAARTTTGYTALAKQNDAKAADTADFTARQQRIDADNTLTTSLMEAQGIKSKNPNELKGETLAVSLHYIQQALAEDIADLSDAQLEKLGLNRELLDLKTSDPKRYEAALLEVVAATNWSSVNDFEHSLLLASLVTHHHAMEHPGAAEQGMDSREMAAAIRDLHLGIPQVEIGKFAALHTLPAEQRYAALARLEFLEKKAVFFDYRINLSMMRSGQTGFDKDDSGGKLRESLQKLTQGGLSPKEEKALRDQIVLLVKADQRLEKADIILRAKTHSSTSKAENMQRAVMDKALTKPPKPDPKKKPDQHEIDVQNAANLLATSVTRDKVGQVGAITSHNVAALLARADLTLETGKILATSENGDTLLASLKQIAYGGLLLQKATLEAFAASGKATLTDFVAEYEAELQGGKSYLETGLCRTISENLQKTGVSQSNADTMALTFLLNTREAGLVKTMNANLVVAETLDMVNALTSARSQTPKIIEKLAAETELREATVSILGDMKNGGSLTLDQERAVHLGFSGEVGGVSVAVRLGAGMDNGVKIFRDENGKASLLIGHQYEASIGAAASLCNDIVGVAAEVHGAYTNAIALTFPDDDACAAFVARLVTGQAVPSDLGNCAAIATVITNELGASVLAKVDIGEALGFNKIDVSAEASAALDASREVSHGMDGVMLTTTWRTKLAAGVEVALAQEESANAPSEAKELMGDLDLVRQTSTSGTAHELDTNEKAFSASITYDVAHSAQVLKDHSGRVVKGAANATRIELNNVKDATNFLKDHAIPDGLRDDVTRYIASHYKDGQDAFSLTLEYELPQAFLRGGDAKTIRDNVDNSALYTLKGIVIGKAEEGAQRGRDFGISSANVTYRTHAQSEKQVRFSPA